MAYRFYAIFRQVVKHSPDIRRRWEGTLENADGSGSQRFAIEVTQTLTKLRVCSYSSIASSDSILAEIASSASEDTFIYALLFMARPVE